MFERTLLFSLLLLSVRAILNAHEEKKEESFVRWLRPRVLVNRGSYSFLSCESFMGFPGDSFQVEHLFGLTKSVIYNGSMCNPDVARPNIFCKERVLANQRRILDIINLNTQYEDLGYYSCCLSSQNHARQLLELSFQTPIRSIELRSKRENHFASHNQGLELKKGKNGSIICMASMQGTHQIPVMNVLIDGTLDITDKFVQKVETSVRVFANGQKLLKSISYLTYETSNPPPSFDGRSLTCIAVLHTHTNSHSNTTASVSSTIRVR